MKAVIQRVKNASVKVGDRPVSEVQKGILTLLGIEKGDTLEQLEKMIQKICGLRIFEDDQGKMNLSLKDIQGEHLIVSQFTLAGDCSTGRRPSFTTAEEPGKASEMVEKAIELSQSLGVRTQSGEFRAEMDVSLINDGPATFILSF